jgi:transcriptional regulator with XRE-family HTH domain
MDEHLRLGAFLRSRRARIRPEHVGLSATSTRRVAGLRREEIADRAGLSLDYYIRLEQGRERHPSTLTLDALARALGLSDQERRHLHALVRPPRVEVEQQPETVRRSVRRMLELLRDSPSFVLGRNLDILAWTPAGAALLGEPEERNLLRLVFLDARSRELCRDWDAVATQLTAWLRRASARRTCQPDLCRLVDELSESAEFIALWDRHEVAAARHGTHVFDHPHTGLLLLAYDALALDHHQILLTYTATDEPAQAGLARLRELHAVPA